MEFVVFLLVAVALYLVADKLLILIEDTLGRTLEQRSVVFFALLLVMSVISFWLLRTVLG